MRIDRPTQPSLIKNTIRLLKVMLEVNPHYFFSAFLTIFFASITPVATAFLFSQILNILVGDGPKEPVLPQLALLTAVYCMAMIISMTAEEYFAAIIYIFYRYDLQKYFVGAITKKTPELDTAYFEDPKLSDLRTNALDAYEWRPGDALRAFFQMVKSAVSGVFALSAVLFVFPAQSLVIFCSIIPGVLVDFKFKAGLWDIWSSNTTTRRKFGRLLGFFGEESYVKEIKLLGITDFLRDTLLGLINGIYSIQKKVQHRRSFFLVVSSTIPLLVIAYFLYAFSLQVLAGALVIGTLSFYISNMVGLKDQFGNTLSNLGNFASEMEYVATIFNFLDAPSRIIVKENAIREITLPPTLEFKDVGFKYPGLSTWVIRNLNLRIEAGQKIAIIGENGAGKTTLVKLMLRLYDVTEGELLVNGINIKDLDLNTWHKYCSVLLQDYELFKIVSIEENIALGRIRQFKKEDHQTETTEQIIKAAKEAKITKVIEGTPKGYKTILGRDVGGVDLSGGENQRLALARTFYRNADLVIMDEPTSAVDAKAEAEIFDSLRSHLSGKTVIFISHRFSTVRNADRIVVIEAGKIEEDGSHEELLAGKGLYHKMFTLQARGYL